jgi:hypothetical protein
MIRSKILKLLYRLHAAIGIDGELLSTQENVFSVTREVSSKERAVDKILYASETLIS